MKKRSIAKLGRLSRPSRLSRLSRLGRLGRVVAQSALLAALWYVADFLSRHLDLPIPGSVIGLAALLALLLAGGIRPRWVKAGADWMLSELLLFFVPAAVAVVQYGGLFRAEGWRLALVVVCGTLTVLVAVAVTVDQAVRLERRLAMRRAHVGPAA